MTIQDLASLLALIFSTVAIVLNYRSNDLSRRQFGFEVMTNLVSRYQEILHQLRSTSEEERRRVVSRYASLCNEELFYFKHRYLPDEVIDEWIDGMLDVLPAFDNSNHHADMQSALVIESSVVAKFPRIRAAFRMDRRYDLSNKKDRLRAVKKVRRNLKGI